jgi:hypothetical protein
MTEEYERFEKSLPASGDDAEDLLGFIENETPEDVYLREKRDLDREMMYLRRELNEQLKELNRFFSSIHLKLDAIDKFHKKYTHGSSEENDIHIS